MCTLTFYLARKCLISNQVSKNVMVIVKKDVDEVVTKS